MMPCAVARIALAGRGERRSPHKPSSKGGFALCADCGAPIGHDSGPPDGWQLEDGRTVCQAYCIQDTHKLISLSNPVAERLKALE